MNKFAAYGSSKGLTMSYYDYKNNYLAQLAQNYTMFDAWHHALFGGSWGNHIWLVCPNQPVFPDAPEEMINQVDKDLKLIYPDRDEVPCTPDRYAVNTIYSVNPPHPSYANISWALPLQNYTTIGDLMTEAGISWNWYAGGWNDAMAGKADPSFQFHHHPFNYFAPYAPGQPGRERLKDYDDLIAAIKDNKLPQVSFYKPIGKYNMHPGYSVVGGEAEVMLRQFVETVQNSPYWEKTLLIITFDEHGGRWDHVAPPKIDRWGPGSRIPTLFVSPLVRKGYVDSTYHDSTSIMRFIQQRYGLRTLGTRDAMQKDFIQCFEGYNDMPGWVIGVISACAFIVALAIGIGIYQTVSHFVRGKREPYTTVV
jgi:phospholipase C